MAYLGPKTTIIPCYRDKWRPMFGVITTAAGTQEQTLEQYQCEHCGAISAVLGKAEEAFYCRQCRKLIGVA